MEDNQKNNRPNRQKENNPMWSRHHTMASRQKMSDSHKAYQQRIHQNQSNSNDQKPNYVQKPMTMQEFLSNNPELDIKGYIKSLMMKEDVYRKIIREEIEKYLWKEQHRTISIPI